MVLAIGLLVDDAIIVVENVERLMSEEGLTPVEATRRSMDQITGALVGIATVLSAVFLPMAFLQGSTGVIYRQFSITIVSAMVLSVIVAIVLTPALCATLLQPVTEGRAPLRARILSLVQPSFSTAAIARYQGAVVRNSRAARPLPTDLSGIGLAHGSAVPSFAHRVPAGRGSGSFDRAWCRPRSAPRWRGRNEALDQLTAYFLEREKETVKSVFTIAGWSFSGGGQNVGIGFVLLKDWSERKAQRLGVDALQARANAALAAIRDAMVFAFAPPPVFDLGNSAGFDFFLKDNNGQGHEALTAARNQFLDLASKDKRLANVRASGLEDAPQFRLDVDAEKAASFGVSLSEVNDALAVAWGGRYIDDFIDRGRVKHVILQADAPFRMVPEDFERWSVRNAQGNMVSVASIAKSHWEYGSPRLERYNGVVGDGNQRRGGARGEFG